VQIFFYLLLSNGKSQSQVYFMSKKMLLTELQVPNTGLMYNSDGVIMIHMILKDTLVPSSWIIQLTIWVFIHLLLVAYLVLTLLTTCMLDMVAGSMAPSSFFNKPWTKLWKLIQHCMFFVSVFVNAYSFTHPSPRSHTSTLKTIVSYSQTKLSGLSMTLMSTESPFTRHLKVTWLQSLSTELYSCLILEPVNFSWKSFIPVSGQARSVLVSLPNGRLLKKLPHLLDVYLLKNNPSRLL